MKWLEEFFNPELKCGRLGHLMVPKSIKIRKRSDEWREVVADFKATEHRCKRCGVCLAVEVGEKVSGFSGCKMPTSMWEVMDRDGFVVLS